MRATLLLVALFIGLVWSQATCPAPGGNTCNAEGSCLTYPVDGAYCACASGFGGLDCATPAAATCPFNSVSATSTSNIPIAVLASYTNDQLTVSVRSPLVTERAYSTIWLDDSVANNANCTYPGRYWNREFDSCSDRFVGVMPWARTNACGWVLDSSDLEYFTYDTNMLIQHHDLIDPFAGRTGQVLLSLIYHKPSVLMLIESVVGPRGAPHAARDPAAGPVPEVHRRVDQHHRPVARAPPRRRHAPGGGLEHAERHH
jgi:hypothetical protein